jgi:alkylated DNA repair dioxygenase AlkB
METLEIAPGSFIDLHRNWTGSPEALFRMVNEEVVWEQRSIKIYGNEVPVPRLTAWYGSKAYTYSGETHVPQKTPPTLAMLFSRLRRDFGYEFNSVLCNLYRNGKDSVGLHADDEPELGLVPLIASVSLGATRKFVLRPILGEGMKLTLDLHGGDLLVMRGRTQETHKHEIPKQAKVIDPRINLTFRTILG